MIRELQAGITGHHRSPPIMRMMKPDGTFATTEN